MKGTGAAYPRGMMFLSGKKTWLGILGLALGIAQCLIRHGFSVDTVVKCVTDIISTGSALGAAGMLTALGLIHKREKASR